MRTDFKCVALLLVVAVTVRACAQEDRKALPTGGAPSLAVKIMHDGTPRLSNLERIPIEIDLQSAVFDLPGIPIITDLNTHKNVSGTWLEISAVDRSNNKIVAIHIVQNGGGLRPLGTSAEKFITLLLDIPDEAQRDRQIHNYILKLVSDTKKNSKTDPELAELYSKSSTQAVVATQLEKLYLQNRAGSFELRCRFVSRSEAAGMWKGQVEAAPVKFEVEYKGDFFNQPNFK